MTKQKSFDDWTKKINSISPETFEHLCEHLLEDMKFKNISVKKGSADDGRDIEAEFPENLIF